jgi:hypothetical protein
MAAERDLDMRRLKYERDLLEHQLRRAEGGEGGGGGGAGGGGMVAGGGLEGGKSPRSSGRRCSMAVGRWWCGGR